MTCILYINNQKKWNPTFACSPLFFNTKKTFASIMQKWQTTNLVRMHYSLSIYSSHSFPIIQIIPKHQSITPSHAHNLHQSKTTHL